MRTSKTLGCRPPNEHGTNGDIIVLILVGDIQLSGKNAKSFLEKPGGRQKRDGLFEECIMEGCDLEEVLEYWVIIATPIVCAFFNLLSGMKKFVHIIFPLYRNESNFHSEWIKESQSI